MVSVSLMIWRQHQSSRVIQQGQKKMRSLKKKKVTSDPRWKKMYSPSLGSHKHTYIYTLVRSFTKSNPPPPALRSSTEWPNSSHSHSQQLHLNPSSCFFCPTFIRLTSVYARTRRFERIINRLLSKFINNAGFFSSHAFATANGTSERELMDGWIPIICYICTLKNKTCIQMF